MSRKATGTVQWFPDADDPAKGHYKARLRLPNPHDPKHPLRPWVDLPRGLTEAEAKAEAWKHQQRAIERNYRPAPKTTAVAVATALESVEAWFARWIEARKRRGKKWASTYESRAKHWIFPRLGPRPMAQVTRREVEQWVEWIDAEVQAEHLGWRTAIQTWSILSKMFTDACGSKTLSLRVREDDPTEKVAGPDEGIEKAKQFLYPSEFIQLVTCEAVPLAIRRAYAIAIYVYSRKGESRAVEWADLDLDHVSAHLHQAVSSETGDLQSTKGKAARRIGLEPAIVPLLRAMRAEASDARFVLEPWPLAGEPATQLRGMLRRAGVGRAELLTSTATTRALTFHDLRATGVTWAAVRGDDPLRIMFRAGHKDLKTTLRYVRAVEDLKGTFGAPFPPLPECLLGGSVYDRSTGSGGVCETPDEQAVFVSEPLERTIPNPDRRGHDPARFEPNRGEETREIVAERVRPVPLQDRSETVFAAPQAPGVVRVEAPLTARQELVEVLTDAVRDMTLAGDLQGARIALDALTRLLGALEDRARAEDTGPPITVRRGRP